MPPIFFLIFALPHVHDPLSARELFASFAAFSMFGVSLFQFGVGVANERGSAWERTMRLLPVSAATRIAARLAISIIFSLFSLSGLVVVATLLTPLSFSSDFIIRVASGLFVGSIATSLIGLALGYSIEPSAAVPVCNAIYFPAAYIGGLFGSSTPVPSILQRLAPLLPTSYLSKTMTWAATAGPLPTQSFLALGAFAVVSAIFATLSYERDTAQRYG